MTTLQAWDLIRGEMEEIMDRGALLPNVSVRRLEEAIAQIDGSFMPYKKDKSKEAKTRIAKIEEAIAAQDDMTMSQMLILAGEWYGLSQSIGRREGPWAMITRLTGF